MWQWIGGKLQGAMNEAGDDLVQKMLHDKYTDNMLMILSVMKKMSFFNGMELLMRATQGENLERPLGSHLHLSPWEALLLNPVHLHRFPVEDNVRIDTATVIGPQAAKPLELRIPICISGMSYGSALSKNAKIALAKAATIMGTATNTGETGLLHEEREAAEKLIGQFNRGGFLNSPDKYKQLDAIEIQLGQGAQGAAPQRTQAKFIDAELRQVVGLKEGEDKVIHSRLPGVNSHEAFIGTVKMLKGDTQVPVGMKIAATHYLEQEMDIGLTAGVDFITVDGAEAGSHAASPTLEDDLGLPTIYAIARARRFLEAKQAKGKVSLIASGGLITPGQFMKALALGADAVYIGTAAMMALISQQIAKVAPTEPPTQLILHTGRAKDKFDIDLGAESLVNFLTLAKKEISAVMYTLGKTAVSQLAPDDLNCLDPFLARALGVAYAGVAPDQQESYYQSIGFPAGNNQAEGVPQEQSVH